MFYHCRHLAVFQGIEGAVVVVGHLVEDEGVDRIMGEDTTMVVEEEVSFSHVGKLV